MTLQEAIATQPAWIGIWVTWLMIATLGLPLVLLVWRDTRVIGIVTALATVAAGMAVGWLYDALGYVKLLGLGHLVIWGPLLVFLIARLRKQPLAPWQRWIVLVIALSIAVSLVFDVVDVARYLLGERLPAAGLPD